MRVPVNWLKELVATKKTPQELADLFVSHGLSIESLFRIGERFENTLVAEVIELNPNQIAIATDTSSFSINYPSYGLKLGDKVVFDPKTEQLVTKIEVGLEGKEPIVLPNEAIKGEKPSLYLDDYVLDFEITPNRGDLMGVIGIARELACYEDKELQLTKLKFKEDKEPIEGNFQLEVIDKEGCPDYIARLIKGVKVAPSPFWLQWRIYACGLRPVNNVVDVSNYILFKYGQPLHTFDYDKLIGKKIIVRRAQKNEKIKTIDGVERNLAEAVLMIADANRSVAVAGIMGGIDTEISITTKNVLLECARFNPVVIRRGSQFLKLTTEASKRFEMGIDSENLEIASYEAAGMISDLAQGSLCQGKIEFRTPGQAKYTKLYPKRVNELLGVKLNKPRIKKILVALGFKLKEHKTYWQVQIPSWRPDVQRDADLIEEIGRIYGYQAIPSRFELKGTEPGQKNPISQNLNKIRNILVGYGFSEVYTVSFTDEASARLFYSGNLIKIPNPLNERFSVLRPCILPTILEIVNWNIRKGNKDLRLFEIGKVFTFDQEMREALSLAGVITGNRQPNHWSGKTELANYFDLKALLETLFAEFQLKEVQYISTNQSFLQMQDATTIKINNTEIGFLGSLAKNVLARYELETTLYGFEIALEPIWQLGTQDKYFRPLPKFPGVVRDFAFVVAKTIPAQNIKTLIQQLGGELLEKVEIFDCFTGGSLEPTTKNLGVRLVLRASDRTLSDTEANQIFDQILQGLKASLPLKLRGE
ncbi:MAG: phenylalanine--tRNA ligase subunit beta [candidate division WOR-3 bacterium]